MVLTESCRHFTGMYVLIHDGCAVSFVHVGCFRVMEAYENAKAEIEGENTVFEDVAAGWHSLIDRFRTKDNVSKYDPEGEGNTDIDAIFDGNVSYLSARLQ